MAPLTNSASATEEQIKFPGTVALQGTRRTIRKFVHDSGTQQSTALVIPYQVDFDTSREISPTIVDQGIAGCDVPVFSRDQRDVFCQTGTQLQSVKLNFSTTGTVWNTRTPAPRLGLDRGARSF